MTAVLSAARYGTAAEVRPTALWGSGATAGPRLYHGRSGTPAKAVPLIAELPLYGVHLTFGFTWPVQLKMAMLSQPFPLLAMLAGSHPLPVTAYQVGSQ